MIRMFLTFTSSVLIFLLSAAAVAAPLIEISITPEGRIKASAGAATPSLVQGGWTDFEIAIDNAAGLTSPLVVESRQFLQSAGDMSRARWLKLEVVPSGPLTGQREETRVLRLWSRDAGRRAAVFKVNAGQGSQDLGFRSDVLLTFAIKPAATADSNLPFLRLDSQPETGVPAALLGFYGQTGVLRVSLRHSEQDVPPPLGSHRLPLTILHVPSKTCWRPTRQICRTQPPCHRDAARAHTA